MPRRAKYPFLVQQGGTIWHARLDIPADVRGAFGGKKVLIRTTKRSDPDAAWAMAQEWVTQWKAEIEAARNGTSPSRSEDIARRFAALKGDPTMSDFYRVTEVAEFVAKEVLGLTEGAWQEALVANNLDPLAALLSVKGETAVKQVEELTQSRTPFDSKVTDFEQMLCVSHTAKTAYQYGRDIRAFAALPGVTVETFAARHVQEFINSVLCSNRHHRAVC